MFKRTLQQQQQFKDSAYIKYGKKGHFTKDYKGGQQNHAAKGTNMAQNNNHIKATKKYSIRHFVFYYNSACRVHEDAKYSIKWWLQKLKLSHAKAIQELDDEQDRIYYGIDIYSNTMSPELVIHSIKEVNKDISNKEISQQEEDELLYTSKVEINTATDSIIIAGTETPLDIIFIAL